MDILVYVVFGLVIIALIGMWIWVMRTVAKTSAMLEDATNEVEDIVEEVKLVAQDFTDVTDDLEQARIRDQTSPKTRRCTDTKDN